jgi:hypothetical protein
VDFLGEKQRDLTEQNFEFNRSEDLNWFNYIVSWLVVWKKMEDPWRSNMG